MRDGKRSENQAHPSITASFNNRLSSVEPDTDARSHSDIPRNEENTDNRVIEVADF